MSSNETNCAIHPLIPITAYCQSCKDLVCERCVDKQPHCGVNHQIKPLEESANIRRNYYLHHVTSEINPMRERTDEKTTQLEANKQATEMSRRVIEKDINIQFQGIADRLEDQLDSKTIHKQTQIKHLEQFVQSLDDLNEAFDSIYENPPALLVSYKSLDQELKKLQAKEPYLISEIGEEQKPLPRQFLTVQQKVATLPQYQQRTKFMNQLIQKLILHYKARVKDEKNDTVIKQKQIKQRYTEVLQKLTRIQLAKVCVFCGHPFTIDNLNESCCNNRSFKINSVYPGVNWQAIIPEDVRGSKRHFWYRSDAIHRKRPELQAHELIRKTVKKHFLNSLLELEGVKYSLERYEIEHGKNFRSVVANNDPSKTGYISKVAFAYILSKTYNIAKVQIDSLVGYLLEQRGINIDRFMELLQNPTKQYNKFLEEEESMQRSKPVAPTSSSKFKY